MLWTNVLNPISLFPNSTVLKGSPVKESFGIISTPNRSLSPGIDKVSAPITIPPTAMPLLLNPISVSSTSNLEPMPDFIPNSPKFKSPKKLATLSLASTNGDTPA